MKFLRYAIFLILIAVVVYFVASLVLPQQQNTDRPEVVGNTAPQTTPELQNENEQPQQQEVRDQQAQPEIASKEEVGSGMPIITEEISYAAGDTTLNGYLAMPENAQNRPGVLVVHEWWGHNDYVRKRAEMLAEMGYVAFAVDMYGEGKNTRHPEEAQKFMQAVVNNREEAQARFQAALALLKSQPQVKPEQTAAIGYCFGGAVVLSMGRSGADLDAVVSFHGALGGLPPVAENVDTRFLVLNGAQDPLVTNEQIQQFKQSMDEAGVEYEFVQYQDAKHGFTNPAATEKGQKYAMPLEYNPQADRKSWQRMQEFLANTFQE